jgi:RNA polymerase primary sigma factor
MVQRMGRIIRPKDDNRPATFIILYVQNTSEDPERGAHDAFLNEMFDNADEIQCFSNSVNEQDLLDWYFEY